MPPDLVIEIQEGPEAALGRLAQAINRRPARAFGIVKTKSEFVGVVAGDEFEVWERRRRAVHAVGRLERDAAGRTTARVTFRLSPPTRIGLALFFLLYAVVAAGLASQPADPAITPTDVAIAAAGALLLVILFDSARRRQRRDLSRFLATALGPDRA